jgi:hypothetical protein
MYLLITAALLVGAACDGRSANDTGAAVEAEHPPADHAAGHAEAHATGDALPLRPIMQQLAADLSAFSYALWVEDYDQMTARSAAMADHPHIAPEEIQRIQAELGAEMADFEEADESVHRASVALHKAADARRLDDVLLRLDEVQRGCVSCHTRFRDRLRSVAPPP